eukprot:1392105-Amorphochlora_amoeboformis.AAC.3
MNERNRVRGFGANTTIGVSEGQEIPLTGRKDQSRVSLDRCGRRESTGGTTNVRCLHQINWVGKFGAAGMGFGMGFFVGSSVVAISGLINPQ